jgi:4-hydroxy-tetrahydrodipicolinate reductase
MPKNSSTRKVNVTVVGKTGKTGRAVVSQIQEDSSLALSDDGDITIDFSTPEGTIKAIELGKPLVCGTTGLSKKHFDKMEALSKTVPVLYSPNFSIGVCLLFQIAEAFSEKIKRFGKISIDETHHTSKRDAPSGTALRLGTLLDAKDIESNRKGETVGIHQLNVLLGDDQLILRHEAHSRAAFAKGAIAAAKFLLNRPPRLYDFSEILVENFSSKEA